MKKKVLLGLVLFASLFVLAGCGNKNKDIQLITETKSQVESVSSQIFKNNENMYGSVKTISAEYFESYFMSLSYDMITNLEEQYNKGIKVYINYSAGEENGMITGKDESDETKYHIYIGSETYNDIWSYATINLATGEISWQDNY